MIHFSREEEYRDWVQRELDARLVSASSKYVVLRSKNVNDIIVCKQESQRPLALFIEVKYFTAIKQRLGLGDRQGRGFQPEILVRRPQYFERYVRWLIGSQEGLAVLASSDDLRRHAVGHVFREGKQNNIQPSVFASDNRPFPLDHSPEVVIDWLESV